MKPWLKKNRRRHSQRGQWQTALEQLEVRELLAAIIAAAPAAITALEDTATVISRVAFPFVPGDVTSIAFTSAPGDVTVTLEVSSGTLTLKKDVPNGLTEPQLIFNGTKKITFSADVTSVNTTLADLSGLTYMPNKDFNGGDTLKISIENGTSSDSRDIPIVILAVNDAPSFTLPTLPDDLNQLVVAILPGDLVQTKLGFATNIKKGPANEAAQVLDFQLTTTNDALFTVAPAIDKATGTLTYTLNPLALNPSGIAEVSVKLHDNGGTANTGKDTSAAQKFTITAFGPVNAVYNSVAGAKLRAFVVNGVLTVQANGIPFVNFPSTAIKSLTFNCGAKNDEIDLSGVTSVLFPNLETVKINGGAGNDRLVGSFATDSIDGGSGNDTLSGGLGNDTLIGNAGTDLLVESGNAALITLTNSSLSGLGADSLTGVENVSLTGGLDINTLDASAFTLGSVTLIGGDGNDTLIGGSKNDALSGQGGFDSLVGGSGNDTISGGLGNDTLKGEAGNDLLIGGFDDDSIVGGAGKDTAVGEQGGTARNGNGVSNSSDDIDAEVINEAFKKLFAFE